MIFSEDPKIQQAIDVIKGSKHYARFFDGDTERVAVRFGDVAAKEGYAYFHPEKGIIVSQSAPTQYIPHAIVGAIARTGH